MGGLLSSCGILPRVSQVLTIEFSIELTFIVCVRDNTSSKGSATLEEVSFSSLTMIGDVNLFLKGLPSDEDFEVEAEIMIAGTIPIPCDIPTMILSPHYFFYCQESIYRRRGHASKALELLLSYATSPESPAPLPIRANALVVRIGEKNEASIRLFEKLGFVITKRVEVFEEVEMRYCGGGGGDGKSNDWRKGVVRVLGEDNWSK